MGESPVNQDNAHKCTTTSYSLADLNTVAVDAAAVVSERREVKRTTSDEWKLHRVLH